MNLTEKILTKTFYFAAAHKLPDYDGPCKNLHGHEWKLEVSIIGLTNPETNMIIDFKELKMIVNEKVINLLDHSYLNDLIPYPTAENIIDWIWDQLWSELIMLAIKNENYYFKLNKLTLYETKDSYITRST